MRLSVHGSAGVLLNEKLTGIERCGCEADPAAHRRGGYYCGRARDCALLRCLLWGAIVNFSDFYD
jgi:hypothetical protein